MDFESLGNIGEFIAAIGVVLSLCYVAYEVRKNSVIQLRNNHRALMLGLHDAIRPAIQDADFAAQYAVACFGAPLWAQKWTVSKGPMVLR